MLESLILLGRALTIACRGHRELVLFSNPNTSFGNSQFGRITSTRLPSREIQLGARFLV
jgi:hypothetical protein